MSSVSTVDTKALEDAGRLEVFDSKGEKLEFGSLFENQKTIIVFIRHFFCGNCMQYVQALNEVRADALSSAEVKVVIVGCGDWELIEKYQAETKFNGDIYAHPERTLHQALGMTTALGITPYGQQTASYLRDGFIKRLVLSFKWILTKNLTVIGKQGNIAQNGGEFILGPGYVCHFAHRMEHTEDHAEVTSLMEKAGVVFP